MLTQEIIKERTVKVNHLPLEMYCMLPYRKKGIITARSEFQCLALQRIIMSREADFTLEPAVCPVQGGVLEITLPAITAILLKAVPKK